MSIDGMSKDELDGYLGQAGAPARTPMLSAAWECFGCKRVLEFDAPVPVPAPCRHCHCIGFKKAQRAVQ